MKWMFSDWHLFLLGVITDLLSQIPGSLPNCQSASCNWGPRILCTNSYLILGFKSLGLEMSLLERHPCTISHLQGHGPASKAHACVASSVRPPSPHPNVLIKIK